MTVDDGSAPTQEREDVVLLDVGLPKLHGYEVARQIRQQPWGRRVMLLAVTGWGAERDGAEERLGEP